MKSRAKRKRATSSFYDERDGYFKQCHLKQHGPFSVIDSLFGERMEGQESGIRDLLSPFARSISAKISALNVLALTKSQRARLLESISDDIKKSTNFVMPQASKAALQEAASLGIDLYAMGWHEQPRFDVGRTTFHWEHIVPVSAIRQECIQAPSEYAVLEILLTRPRVAWILKRENTILTSLGYRHKRSDPDAAYREAGIELIARS